MLAAGVPWASTAGRSSEARTGSFDRKWRVSLSLSSRKFQGRFQASSMKKALGLLGVFVLFLAAVVAALAIVIPRTDLAKRMLVAGTRAKTGLELQINGPMTLRLVPSVSLRMEGVVLTNPAEPVRPPIIVSRVVELDAGYMAALGATHTLDRIALAEPVITVETDKQGRYVWQPDVAVTREAPARVTRGFAFSTVEIKGGTISYRDQRNGATVRLERADIALRNVSQESVGEALVKAGATAVLDPATGMSVEVADLDAKAGSFSGGRIASFAASGSTLRWRDRTQPSGIEATKFAASADALGLDGAGRVSFSGGMLSWRDPASGSTLSAENLETAAGSLRGGRLADVTFKSNRFAYAHPASGSLSIGGLAGSAKAARLDALDELAISSASVAYDLLKIGRGDASAVSATAKSVTAAGVEDVTVRSTAAAFLNESTGTVRAGAMTFAAKNATPARLQGFAFTSGSLSLLQPTRSAGASPLGLEEVSIAAPVLALGAPVDATVAFTHRKDRVSGTVKLPPPETLAAGPAVPANVSLKASHGSIDFDGRIETGAIPSFKGRARAATTSVEALASWLGMSMPATVKGPADLAGDIDATSTRAALDNARIGHGANVLTGSVAIDVAGARPKISGKIAADKLDADAYLGVAPVKPRPQAQAQPGGSKPQVIEPEAPLSDVFKTYMRAMIDAPVTRGGTLEIPAVPVDELIPAATRAKSKQPTSHWSEEKFDLSGLRAIDLDVDWAVKSLGVRGMQFAVPQLKTVLDDGALTLEGSGLGTKDGKLSGRARIDARQPVPSISANVKGEGVDLYAMSEAFGVTPLLDGDTGIDADIRSTGNSQRQLIEQLTGTVRTNMAEGHVLGYDLGNITLGTVIRWLTGNREYDPERRTRVTGLNTDLKIEKGVVKESTVTMGGPLLGVNAEGTIGIVDQRLDLNGRARIASFFSGLPFRIFGNWQRPTVQPDLSLASVFSRSAPGEASLEDIIANADIKPDAELALLIGRVMQKAGPSGLDAGTRAFLEGIQKRAIGN